MKDKILLGIILIFIGICAILSGMVGWSVRGWWDKKHPPTVAVPLPVATLPGHPVSSVTVKPTSVKVDGWTKPKYREAATTVDVSLYQRDIDRLKKENSELWAKRDFDARLMDSVATGLMPFDEFQKRIGFSALANPREEHGENTANAVISWPSKGLCFKPGFMGGMQIQHGRRPDLVGYLRLQMAWYHNWTFGAQANLRSAGVNVAHYLPIGENTQAALWISREYPGKWWIFGRERYGGELEQWQVGIGPCINF